MVKTLVTFISIALSLHLLGSIEAHTDAAAHNGNLGQQHHRSLLLRGLVLSGERKTTDTPQADHPLAWVPCPARSNAIEKRTPRNLRRAGTRKLVHGPGADSDQ
jgi:hypothetical protein